MKNLFDKFCEFEWLDIGKKLNSILLEIKLVIEVCV